MKALALVLVMLAGWPGVPEESQESEKPTIDGLAWMAGHWRGEGFGGQVEEIWSEPLGGTMVGTFRLFKDGKVDFYEIMVLEPDAEGIVLKVKHFSGDFTAWEEKADSVDFRLQAIEGHTATFAGLTFERDGDALDIKIRMRSKDGSTRWETLSFRTYQP